MAISMLMIEDCEEVILISTKDLEQITCIQYPIVFQGGLTQVSSAPGFVLALFYLRYKAKCNISDFCR